jgi:hypothetical protein
MEMVHGNGEPEVASTVKFHAIKVKVTPSGTIPPTGAVACDIRAVGNPTGGKVEKNKIELFEGEGPFCLQFDLDNRLEWATQGDLIWIQKNACPEDTCPVPDQMWIDKTPNNRVLTIMDMNVGEPCTFHYRLNFSDGRYCDPVIENSGGNTFG